MIEVFVNGQPADVAQLQFEAQDDPYPGGLTYEIRVEDGEFAAFLGGQFTGGSYERLDTGEANSVFMGLQLLRMQHVQSGAPTSTTFVLNTVDRLILNGSKIELRGVASPAVSGRS